MKQYTVKEISLVLGVSKTTIQKVINSANIEYDEFSRNKQFYGVDKTREIVENLRPEFDFSTFDNQLEKLKTKNANSKTKSENSQTETDNQSENLKDKSANSQTETANSQTSIDYKIIIDELHRSISIFENELKEKNKQIKEKDKEIQQLNEILNKHLYISAKEKKLIEAEAESESESQTEEVQEPKKKEKKGLFKRLFKK